MAKAKHPHIPPITANQQKLLNDLLLNEGFRRLLLNPVANRAKISAELDRLAITFDSADEKEKALDVLAKIDWADLKELENLLGRNKINPAMN